MCPTKSILILLTFVIIACAGTPSHDDIEEKIAQMLIVGFRGYELTDDVTIVEDIRERNLGGVILFDYDVPAGIPERNIQSPEQVQSLNKSLQNLTDETLIIAVDQEGGKVNRLKEQYGFPPTVSHQALGEYDDLDSTRAFSSKMAATLADLGFNLNFAPSVDVNTNPDNPVIGSLERSFSDDPAKVALHSEAFIKGHRENGVYATIKHFPGHGSSRDDSHLGMVDVTETWDKLELEPYRYLIEKEVVDVIMTAHIINNHLDTDIPATLSQKVLTGMLRSELGYDGIIVSDDMQMGAIADHYGLEQALKASINAGVDMLIFANNSVYEEDITQRAIGIITGLVESGEIPRQRIEESYQRIQKLKQQFAQHPDSAVLHEAQTTILPFKAE
ncbi:MAG: glycoside hydrolase family 3 protein [Balneolales bacterium]